MIKNKYINTLSTTLQSLSSNKALKDVMAEFKFDEYKDSELIGLQLNDNILKFTFSYKDVDYNHRFEISIKHESKLTDGIK
jgi:hypothetical protein